MKKALKSVAICLQGYSLKPDLVSQKLGVQPSSVQTKGGFTAGSKRFIAKIGMWKLKVKSASCSTSELIDEIFQRIGHPPMSLDEIDGVNYAYLDIFIATDHSSGMNETAEFDLTKSQIVILNQLGLAVRVTVT